MDGWITIGTELNTNDFDKQFEKTKRKLQQVKKEEEKLNIQKQGAERSLNPYQNELKDLKQLIAESEKLNMTAEQRKYEDSIHQGMLDQINMKYQKQIDNLNNINKKLKQNKGEQELITNQIETMNNKMQLQNINESLNNIGKSTSSTIKKIGKWTLAIFGVRAAYGFVRNAVSTLAQYNEQLATDIEYIKYAVASSLGPLIEKIVQLVYKLLQYINIIAKAWFGIDLFANASADALNRSAKSAKEIKKSLAGFDEMNLVSGGMSDASAGGKPSVNLKNPEDVATPRWLQFIVDNKDTILGTLAGIATGLALIKLRGSEILTLGNTKIAGVVLVIKGFIETVVNLLDYLNKPDWENFGGIMQGLGTIVIGLGVLFLGLPGIIAGVLVMITGYLIKHKDEVQEIWNKLKNWLYEKIINPIEQRFGIFGKMITAPIRSAIDTIENYFSYALKFSRNILDGIIKIFKGDFKNGFIQAGKGILNAIINLINFFINSINTMISPLRELIVAAGKITGKNWTMNNIRIPTIPYLKSGGIINMPGKGIPIGGAIGGEAGREGVLPLTDSQAMEELGSAIGRYITINLTNNTNLDGRTIARQQSKVQANRNFAMNR